jgi:hypothetical protein
MLSTRLSNDEGQACADNPVEYIVGKSNGFLQAVVPPAVFLLPVLQIALCKNYYTL